MVSVDAWLERQVRCSRGLVQEFAAARSAEYFTAPDTELLGEITKNFVGRGKYLRSTLGYLGWLCGQPESAAAVSATASLELLHAFALIQDDVMDDSVSRRGTASVHEQLATWARTTGKVEHPAKFGESAAVLLADLFLVWSERMLRECGLPDEALQRAWPIFDLLRNELAVGQFSDLLNENPLTAELDAVLDVARRKSGNYSVRRPLELGASLAGCTPDVMAALQHYGSAIGEAFQLRDDLLGVFGDPATTGKPLGDDLRQHKASTIIVAARTLADEAQVQQMRVLAKTQPASSYDEQVWIADWQDLISSCGAIGWAEDRIDALVGEARTAVDSIAELPREVLLRVADQCTRRQR